ncbi:MAG: CsgG/HfaB family protein [Kofleriaceae bacterium]
MRARSALILLALLIAGPRASILSLGVGDGRETSWISTARAATGPTVAVLYFDYDGADDELGFLRKGLNQMLVTDLVGLPGITVVERARLEEVLAELKLHRSQVIDRKSAVRAGKLLGARYLVLGSYFVYKDDLNVHTTVVDVETGVVLGGVRDHRPTAEFGALEQLLAARLGELLRDKVVAPAAAAPKRPAPTRATPRRRSSSAAKAAAPSAASAAPSPAVTPSSPPSPVAGAPTSSAGAKPKPLEVHARTAARYGQGLDALDRGDTPAARAAFAAALKLQPDFAAASVDLARLAQ